MVVSRRQSRSAFNRTNVTNGVRKCICNLPYETDESEIYNLFSQYGEVVSVSMPINRETSKTRGFAFVEFDKKESAERALDDKRNIYLKGRKLYIQRFKRSNLRPYMDSGLAAN